MDSKELNDNIELDENQEHDTFNDKDETSKASRDDDDESSKASGGDRDASSEEFCDESESPKNNNILLVPECEMSIDPSHYGLRKELDDGDHFDALVSITSQWDVVKEIKYYMNTSKVFDQIKKNCFGCFFKVDLQNWNKISFGQVAHFMLQRRVVSSKDKELWFIIDGKPIRFGKKELAIITGLNCGKVPTAEALYDEDEAKMFLDRVLDKKSSLIGTDNLKTLTKTKKITVDR